MKLEDFYLWCSDTLQEPGGPFGVFVWDSQIFHAELVCVPFSGSSEGEGVNGDEGKGRR